MKVTRDGREGELHMNKAPTAPSRCAAVAVHCKATMPNSLIAGQQFEGESVPHPVIVMIGGPCFHERAHEETVSRRPRETRH